MSAWVCECAKKNCRRRLHLGFSVDKVTVGVSDMRTGESLTAELKPDIVPVIAQELLELAAEVKRLAKED